MRLWSIHPKYLDSQGLVALWRESLLAKKVLEGNTKGYTNHPQLERFKMSTDPLLYINYYLQHIYNEALQRGFNFDKSKFIYIDKINLIDVTSGQINYEFKHLLQKLEKRSNNYYMAIKNTIDIELHPIFKLVNGEIASWEVINV
ncbi:MAG: DNA lyase [Spirochaetales bacterium]|nr:DNA lyase [Spirochaetales bacterium]